MSETAYNLPSPLANSGTATGSGFYVGDKVIITAGHVMFEFNEMDDVPDRQIKSMSGSSVVYDPRDYENQYRSLMLSLPDPLDPPTNRQLTISAQYIEQVIRSSDIIFVSRNTGEVTQHDAGLGLYLKPSDITLSGFSLPGGKLNKAGSQTLIRDVPSVSPDPLGLKLSAGSIPGDSGGGVYIEFESRKFVIGNIIASNVGSNGGIGTYTISSYLSALEFYQLNTILEGHQSGDVSTDEPTNLIVGSDESDSSAQGTYRSDIMLGKDGNDYLHDGDAEGDLVWANDQLYGGANSDVLYARAGDDLLHGGDFRAYAGSARISLEDDGEDWVDYQALTSRASADDGLTVRIGSNSETWSKTRFGDTTDKAAAIYVIDQNTQAGQSLGTDALISIEKLWATDADDTVELLEFSGPYLAGIDGTGGISYIDLADENGARGSGDLIDASALTINLDIDLSQTLNNVKDKENSEAVLTILDAERVKGGEGDDTIRGNSQNNVLEGGKGDDVLNGRGGDDIIYGGEGNDTVKYDTVKGGLVFTNPLTHQLDGYIYVSGPADDVGKDTLFGIEYIKFTDQNDKIEIEALMPAHAHSTLDGGGGSDLISFENANNGMGVYLDEDGAGSLYDTVLGGMNSIANFQTRIIGSAYADEIVDLTPHDKFVDGGDGNDLIVTGTGDDIVIDSMGRIVAEEIGLSSSVYTGPYSDSLQTTQSVVLTGHGIDIISLSMLDTGRRLSETVGRNDGYKVAYQVNPGQGDDVVSLNFNNGAVDYYYAAGDGDDIINTQADIRDFQYTSYYTRDDGVNAGWVVCDSEYNLFGASIEINLGEIDPSTVTIAYNLSWHQLAQQYQNPHELPSTYLASGNAIISFGDGGSITVDNVIGSGLTGDWDANPIFSPFNVMFNFDGGAEIPEGNITYNITESGESGAKASQAESAIQTGTSNSFVATDTGDSMSIYFGRGEQMFDGTSGLEDELIIDLNPRDINATLDNDILTISDKWGIIGTTKLTGFEKIYLTQTDSRLTPQEFIDYLATSAEVALVGTTADDILMGSSAADQISGLEGNDDLTGGIGDDYLNGGDGQDFMSGGSGDDRYVIDNNGDTVFEHANSGYDSIDSSVNLVLANNVEALNLLGNATMATGNNLDNRLSTSTAYGATLAGLGGNDYLIGGSADDQLFGGTGDDVISGANGQDQLFGDSGRDILNGGTGDDILQGGADDDFLSGDRGSDFLDGGQGSDILYGGDGNDLFAASVGDDIISGGKYVDAVDVASASQRNFEDDQLSLTGQFQDYIVENLNYGWYRITDTVAERDGTDLIFDMAQINFIGAAEGEITSIRLEGPTPSFNPDFHSLRHNATEDASLSIDLSGIFLGPIAGDISLTATLENGDPPPEWLVIQGTDLIGSPPQDYWAWIDIIIEGRSSYGSTKLPLNLFIEPVNDAPTIAVPINDLEINVGDQISIDVTNGMFLDVDEDDLSFIVQLANGAPLPSWLTFTNNIIEGTAPSQQFDPIEIVVTASDGIETVTDGFVINWSAPEENLINGTESDDNITGTDDADHIFGLSGNDYIIAAGGNDTIEGGGGHDNLEGGAGDDILIGGDGNDSLDDGDGDDIVYGGAGSDVNWNGRWAAGNDQIYGEGDDDYLGGGNGDYVDGGDGNDSIEIVGNNATFIGGADDDTISVFSYDRTGIIIDGGDGADTLNLNERRLQVQSITGIEALVTQGLGTSPDILSLTSSVDLSGASLTGFLKILGPESSAGIQILGPSTLLGDASRLWVQTSFGSDLITGSDGADELASLSGDDIIHGAAGNDYIVGGYGNDQLYGDSGNDEIWGEFGDDIIVGGEGDDTLFGGNNIDAAVYVGSSSNYQIQSFGGSVTVVDLDTQADGDEGTDTIVGIENLQFDDLTVSITSPIILDLDGRGIDLIHAHGSNSTFDMDGDGQADDTSWIGKGDGFLFLDRDQNGTVSNVGELSFISDAENARSDLDGLRAFDSNNDGVLNRFDDRFADFGVWQDRNSDGVVNHGEIKTLHQAQIQSLNLSATAVNDSYGFGEVAVLNQGSFTRTNGATSIYLDAAMTFYSGHGSVPAVPQNAPERPHLPWWKARNLFDEYDLLDDASVHHGLNGYSAQNVTRMAFDSANFVTQEIWPLRSRDSLELEDPRQISTRYDWAANEGRFELFM